MEGQGPSAVPRHVAIIMDGNGRWAESRGLERNAGHAAGADSVREITRACRRWGVEALTLYSFSTENWLRPPEEVDALMALLQRFLLSEHDEIMDNGIRLQAIGQLSRLPDHVRLPLEALNAESGGNEGMVLSLALSYGGRAEIVEATRALAIRVAQGDLDPADIDEELFGAELTTAGLPEPDLLIRTSGELRLSNFLLWQLAYAELYVTETLWPDFGEAQLREAFEAFGERTRRFGKTDAQLDGSC